MATEKPKKQSQRKLSKLIKLPIRILIKARDLYVKGMSEYTDRIGYCTVVGCPTGQVVHNLPKSYSVNSANSSSYDEEYMELLRPASTRGLSSRVELDLLQSQNSRKSANTSRANNKNKNNMPRSSSVGIARIDEEKPCEFEEDIKVRTHVFPRSRSYAVGKRSTGVF